MNTTDSDRLRAETLRADALLLAAKAYRQGVEAMDMGLGLPSSMANGGEGAVGSYRYLLRQLDAAISAYGGEDRPALRFSERDLPLVYTGVVAGKPVLTLENYCKWYGFYAIYPDGAIRAVPFEAYDAVFRSDETSWSDHVPAPDVMTRVAEHLGFDVDPQAEEMALGRYHMEVLR